MSIAEKLTTIAENVQKVYEAGKAAGGGSGDYDQGYEDGKNSVVRLEKFVKTMRFYSLNDFGTKEVEINFEKANNFQAMCAFQQSGNDGDYMEKNTTVEHLTISTKAVVRNLQQMFYCDNFCSDTTLKHITFDFELDPNYSVGMNNMFRNMSGVEIIDGKPWNVSGITTFSGTFNGIGGLKQIRFVENTIKASINFSVCSLLSTETIQSIIDGLADLTGSTAQTLTLHATVGGKLTDEQKAAITAKNWTLVY